MTAETDQIAEVPQAVTPEADKIAQVPQVEYAAKIVEVPQAMTAETDQIAEAVTPVVENSAYVPKVVTYEEAVE